MTTSAQVRQRVLTGDTPTGPLHLGHWAGSIEMRLRMQEECDCFFIVANIHALTTRSNQSAQIRTDTLEVVRDWLACGIDPKRSSLFLQSEVPAIAELSWFFAMLLGQGRLMKNPTIKEEIRAKGLGDNYSFGFLMYPVGQIADILAFRPAFVPVGQDQVPHIEMTREIARRFNQVFCSVDPQTPDEKYTEAGGVFSIPEARVGRVARLTGTDGKNKMSKSLNNAIFLGDTPEVVEKKCRKIFTGRVDPKSPGVVEGNPVFEYLQTFSTDAKAVQELKDLYRAGQAGDQQIKAAAAEAINKFLEPIRTKRAAIGDAEVLDALRQGTQRANVVAEETLQMAKKAAGYDYFKRRLEIT